MARSARLGVENQRIAQMQCSGETYPSRSNDSINDSAKDVKKYNHLCHLEIIKYEFLYFKAKLEHETPRTLALAKLRILKASGALNA